MEPILFASLAVFVVVLLVFVVRRILPLVLKLAALGLIVAVLLGVVGVGWWRGWFSSSPRHADRPAAQTNQRANTNRRPTPR